MKKIGTFSSNLKVPIFFKFQSFSYFYNIVHRTLFKYLSLYILLCLLIACKKEHDSGLSQGRFIFDITYLQDRVGSYSTSMLPQQMSMEYKNNYTKNTIEGGLGFFNLVNISDLRNFRNTTYLKFIDRKYIYEGKKREAPCCFGKLDGMQLDFTEKTRVIAGFNCKHAVATFPDDGLDPFDIWYTDEIPLEHPNGISPFRDVPGVMLEFNSLLGDISMHVRAREYEPIVIPDKQFRAPDNYRQVTGEEMEKIIHALLK